MDRGLCGDAGGIRSLLGLIREHREAVEYDLIAHGLRLDQLGTRGLSWRDLLVIVRQSPTGSAVDRALSPKEAPWGLGEQLMAHVADLLATANWQRAGQGEPPKPIVRPGVESDANTLGGGAVPIDEIDAFLSSNQPEEEQE